MSMVTTAVSRAQVRRAHKQATVAVSRLPLLIPVGFALGVAAIGWIAGVRTQERLFWSIEGAAIALLLFAAALWHRARSRALTFDIVLRPQHYLQACAQGTVLLYWGYYWRPVYEAVPLLAAQLLFAFGFDMLLAWWRRDEYTLGFGPVPVIFSTNLFLWFKADYFYLQFLMIALGFAAKELIRWEKDGRRVHIFNPSSFPLAIVSLVLILTGTTSWTWGPEIARTQFNPPNIYLLLFLVGLPGQLLFGVTTMTMSAVVTTYLFGLAYFYATGAYFFVDSYIPVAVFLGMHLLFTDPSTSPRTELGRVIFGVIYGLANVALYELLGRAGVPTFYDKLLPVPLMNLSIKLIDRAARSEALRWIDPARVATFLAGRRRNFAYVSIWVLVFGGMTAVEAVGDNHPGHSVPFWQNACMQNARGACDNLDTILSTYCSDGSGWACNELGLLRSSGRVSGADTTPAIFSRACSLGFAAGCQNARAAERGEPLARPAPPQLRDYPVILRTGKGALPDRTPVEFYTRACEQGFAAGCYSLGTAYREGDGVPRNPSEAVAALTRACDRGHAVACSDAGYMHYTGDGIAQDRQRGLDLLQRACELKHPNACQWLEEARKAPATSDVR